MLTLHLYRHGQTNFNAEGRIQGQHDSILTDIGIEQARNLQPFVSTLNISSAYASTNVRARHTAELMTETLSLDLSLRDELREIAMGRLEQRLYRDAFETDADIIKSFRKDPENYSLEGAESFHDVQSRGLRAVEDIISIEGEGRETKHVLVVSHGAILKTILVHYAGLSLGQIWTDPHLGNCSRNILEVTPDGERRLTLVGDKPIEGTAWAR